MPSAGVDFRATCGTFLPIFINFMAKRARKKAALRIAILTLRRRVDGVTVGLLLCYLYWGSFLMQCGDVESNPGPPMEGDKEPAQLRQTRLSVSGTSRKTSYSEKVKGPRSSASAPPAKDPTLHDVMAVLNEVKEQMDRMDSNFESKFDELKQDVSSLKDDYAALQNDLRGMKDEVTELQKENQDLQKVNQDLCGKLDDCERKIDDLEGRSKRNNLIFYGLPRKENETNADCEEQLHDLLKTKLEVTDQVEFDRVHRLSAKSDSPVIARCTFYKQKINILKAKGKLKGSNIFIGEDFSKGVRDLRRRLSPFLKQARNEGKRATLVFNYLLIDGKRYTVDINDRLIEYK